ncbi:MAG TPA: pyridoxal-phosphate dependent enzyme [Agriterribacter sp.]|nr:pyridoxal-phosphate dependent enzyme [Agriterribacter sp.]
MQELQITDISIDSIENQLTLQKRLHLAILRLDKIHPIVSGNKWFKLQYYLREATEKGYQTLLTFGGAYSNHIAATAYAAKAHGFNAIGVIRGEQPQQWSHTLQEASAQGMQLTFLPRNEFAQIKRNASAKWIEQRFGKVYAIPEGGYGKLGKHGAADILRIADTSIYTHFVSAVGTGTTVAGILQASGANQHVSGISVMKNNFGLADEIQKLSDSPELPEFRLIHDYHFGGYARYSTELLDFMNNFYRTTHIPLDFVYTAKMMFGVFDLIRNDYYPPGSVILAIHTGGLQGNESLPPGRLLF